MIEGSLARPGRKRKCRTNSGKFMSLQAAYRRGELASDDEARYESIVAELRRLYKEARS